MKLGGYWDQVIGQNKHLGAGHGSSKIKSLSDEEFAPAMNSCYRL